MDKFYETNSDFREFVDANARSYGKSAEFMAATPTAQEYKKYLMERDKGKGVRNEVKTYGCQ